jgi:hypothetical protein
MLLLPYYVDFICFYKLVPLSISSKEYCTIASRAKYALLPISSTANSVQNQVPEL